VDTEKAEVITWVIVWDDLGLESLVNLTELECETVMKRLQDGFAPDGIARIMRMTQLRSRLNSHRNPEIWVFEVADDVSETQIRHAFDLNTDGFKQIIRDKGIKQFV
jgi:hypothetical protein